VLTCCFIMLVIVVAITWRMASKYSHWAHRIKKTESDCAQIESHISPKLNDLHTSVNSMNKALTSLVVYLKTKDGKMDASLFQAFSPIRLTEAGEAVLNALDGKAIIENNLKELFANLEAQNVKTALDVQSFAPIVISILSNNSDFNRAKDYIYNHPVLNFTTSDGKELAIQLDSNTLNTVLGIYLRDKFLETHPGIIPNLDDKDHVIT
jgi:hypothetical protein